MKYNLKGQNIHSETSVMKSYTFDYKCLNEKAENSMLSPLFMAFCSISVAKTVLEAVSVRGNKLTISETAK